MRSPLILRVIAGLMLLLAVADHPYSYYQILRWVTCGVAAYSAFLAYENKKMTWVWIFGITAVLFNPIASIHFERETWQVLDVAAALVMFGSIPFFKPVPSKA